MSHHFCTQCGAILMPNSNFCTACGVKVGQSVNSSAPPAPPSKTPAEAVTFNTPKVKAEISPFTIQKSPSIQPPAPSKVKARVSSQVTSGVSQLLGQSILASATAGEMTFDQNISASGGILPGVELGAVKYLLRGMGRALKAIAGVFKDKKRLIPVLAISLLWMVLLVLPALGITSPVLGWLNFLTFAQGGTGGGLLGMAGGLIGKGIFAYFITVMLLPIFTGGKPFSGIGNGLKIMFKSFVAKDKPALASLLLGAGLALICYNIVTGNASLQNSMAGILAFLISLKALANKGGFLRGLIMSMLQKKGKGPRPDTLRITHIMAGWAAGFALGVFLSVAGFASLGYLTGIIVVLGSVGLRMFGGGKKEVVSE